MPYIPLDHNDPLIDRVRTIVSRHVGRDNRIERRKLVAMFPEGDRAIRDAINKCPEICSPRRSGIVLGRGMVGGGYFVASNQQEVNDYIAEMWGQIAGTIERVNAAQEHYKAAWSGDERAEQMSLEV